MSSPQQSLPGLKRHASELVPLTDLTNPTNEANTSPAKFTILPVDEDISWFTQKHLQSKAEYNYLAQMASMDVTSTPNTTNLTDDQRLSPRQTFRKTGIVCTIGPKTNSVEAMVELRKAGMNILRMNFSHGTYDYHASVLENLRASYQVYPGTPVAVALDTKGPEIRTGVMKNGEDVRLAAGSRVVVHTNVDYRDCCDAENIFVDYSNITNVISVGSLIFIDDGLIKLQVNAIHKDTVDCEVLNNGVLSSHKGVNLPNTPVDLPHVSEKDRQDLQWGVDHGVDIVFASFIRNGEALREIRQHLGERGKRIKIISKVENQQGLDFYDEILAESDGIMVARGDLGIEIPVEKVFAAQKMMMARCNILGKSVIVATQMLESMTNNPRPTRAEVSDVANAVLDGADCVMLSGETAKGQFPYLAVETMSQICIEAEKIVNNNSHYKQMVNIHRDSMFTADTLASSAVNAAFTRKFQAIIVFSMSGNTARLVSKYRPACPVICVTTDEVTARQAMLMRGIIPILVKEVWDQKEEWLSYTERQLEYAVDYCKNKRHEPLLFDGDSCVVLQGWAGGTGQANTLRLVAL